MTTSAIRIALVFPELLGTYGDGGNATVLAQRLRWRAHLADVVECPAGAPVPRTCDIYLLGGGEDAPQARAAVELAPDDVVPDVVGRGAVVLAVCGGYQILGHSFAAGDGRDHPGLGVLDVRTTRRRRRRAVGELVADPTFAALPVLTGFENHGGATALGPQARPLASVQRGFGNGTGDGTEGAVAGRVFGTYFHGPVLARNPAFADHLLELVTGPLPPIADDDVDRLRTERLGATTGGRRR